MKDALAGAGVIACSVDSVEAILPRQRCPWEKLSRQGYRFESQSEGNIKLKQCTTIINSTRRSSTI